MKRILWVMCVGWFLFSGIAFAADSMTVTPYQTGALKYVKIDWVDTPSLTLESQSAGINAFLKGYHLYLIITIPGAAAAKPDDLYDIVISNSDGIPDITGGQLADRDADAPDLPTQPKILTGYGPYPIKAGDALTFTVTNQTNAAGSGTVYLFFASY